MSHHTQLGELSAKHQAIDARLSLQRQHAVDSLAQQPGDHPRDVSIGVDENHRSHLLQTGHDLPIVRRNELVEMTFGDHRSVVVRHVLGDWCKSRAAGLGDPIEDPQIEVGQVPVNSVNQLRLVVEGQADLCKAHQGPREPEIALQRAMVLSHHIAHSQQGRRSTGRKFIRARKHSTWFIPPATLNNRETWKSRHLIGCCSRFLARA